MQQWSDGAAQFLMGNNIITGGVLLLCLIIFLCIKKQQTGPKKEFQILVLLTLFFIILLSLKFSVFAPHYILPFWVMALLILPLLLEQIVPKRVGVGILILIFGINFAFSLSRLNNNHGYTMPDGLSMNKIMAAGEIIGQDSKTHTDFNVASILDGNTRNYPLRYTVLLHKSVPGEVDQYPNNKFLYVTSRSNQNELLKAKTWEIASFSPLRIGKKWDLGENVYLYRLDRESK